MDVRAAVLPDRRQPPLSERVMYLFLALFAAGLARSAEAADLPDPLEPEGFAAAVLAAHPGLEAAAAATRAAEARRDQARTLPPTQLSAAFAPFMAPSTMGASSVGAQSGPGYQLGVEQMLPAPGSRAAARRVAEAGIQASEADYRQVNADLYALALSSLAEAWRVEQVRAALEEQRAWTATQLAAARGRVEAGTGMSEALWMLELELASMDAELTMAAGDLDAAQRQLRALVALPADQALPTLALPSPRFDAAAAPPDETPTLAAARARAEGAEAEQSMIKAMNRPMPGLMLEYGTLMAGQPMAVVGASLSLSRGGGARSDEAAAMAQMARADLAAMGREQQAMLGQAEAEFQAAGARIDILDSRALPLAQTRLQVADAALAAGMGSLDASLDAARALTAVRLQLAEARAAQWRARAMQGRVLGVPADLSASVSVEGAP